MSDHAASGYFVDVLQASASQGHTCSGIHDRFETRGECSSILTLSTNGWQLTNIACCLSGTLIVIHACVQHNSRLLRCVSMAALVRACNTFNFMPTSVPAFWQWPYAALCAVSISVPVNFCANFERAADVRVLRSGAQSDGKMMSSGLTATTCEVT